MLHRYLNHPNWAPLLIIWKRHIVMATFLVELPRELGVICTGIVGTCNCIGRICESRGLSNLTPARSRLFKLIGRVKGMRWSCSKRLAYMVATTQKRARREAKHGREARSDQEVILEQPTSYRTPTPCSLPGPRREETITVKHAVDGF